MKDGVAELKRTKSASRSIVSHPDAELSIWLKVKERADDDLLASRMRTVNHEAN